MIQLYKKGRSRAAYIWFSDIGVMQVLEVYHEKINIFSIISPRMSLNIVCYMYNGRLLSPFTLLFFDDIKYQIIVNFPVGQVTASSFEL